MSRYIDADALIKEMEDKEPLVWNDDDHELSERNQWQYDMATIQAMPTIDIVRCKDCKHRKLCCRSCYKNNYSFCSDGERKVE